MEFKVGERCFAKVKGWPTWPARINSLPSDIFLETGKVPVFFYGTHEISLLSKKSVFSYNDENIKKYMKEDNASFMSSLEEAKNSPQILQYGHDEEAITYLEQFYTFDVKKAKKESLTVNENWKNNYSNAKRRSLDIPNEDPRAKIARTMRPDSKKTQNEMKTKKLGRPRKKIYFESIVRRDVNITEAVINLERLSSNQVQSETTEQPTSQLEAAEISNTKEEVVTDSEPSPRRPIRATAKIFLHNMRNPVVEAKPSSRSRRTGRRQPRAAASPGSTAAVAITRTSKTVPPKEPRKRSEPRSKSPKSKASSSCKSEIAKLKNIFFPDETELSNETSSSSNKKTLEEKDLEGAEVAVASTIVPIPPPVPVPVVEEVEQVEDKQSKANRERIVTSKLSFMEHDIRSSLSIGSENYTECLCLMQTVLDWTDIGLTSLCRVSEIVDTIKKCARYKKNKSVKEKANQMYSKFVQIKNSASFDEKCSAGAILLSKQPEESNAANLMSKLFHLSDSTISPTPSQTGSSNRDQSHKNPPPSSSGATQQTHKMLVKQDTPLSGETVENHIQSAEQCEESEDVPPADFLDPENTDLKSLLQNGQLKLTDRFDADEDADQSF